ncbi:MAG TPA: hypothetical protein VFQ36_00930 [Ktedonobacteraceae bacterium]|nr:hypothetical protein [Ktedonobacteraceae bacterium]
MQDRVEQGDRKGRLYYERPGFHGRVIVEATLAVALLFPHPGPS